MTLLDARGNPIPKSFAKGKPPITGEAFAPRWAGDVDKYIFGMPGGGSVMFDLSRLTLADFRTMRDHYQVNATLAVLTFMMHQMDWKIECDNSKITKMVEENVEMIWTPLIRAISQAFWSGYSPNILQWENTDKYIQLTKVKDLIPEECFVNWKQVDGWAPPNMIKPRINVYDGIKVFGQQWPTPVENSFWYPLLMENGDYYGRKLLRPVFTSWYFSILVHLFSNRCFERFGEPVPVGRASYEEEITVNTSGGPKKILGADLMTQVLQNLRNRSVVVLPNDRTQIGTGTGGSSVAYDYDIEYLESQMRGADFERYLMRLDEEISLGLFTPLLILRTADVGSYNLGSTHWNMYLNMLNAIAGDVKAYIDNFILSRLVDYNFGTKSPRAVIVFRKLGDDRKDTVMAILQALMGKGTVKPDLNELGDIAGLTLTEVKAVLSDPNADPNANPADPNAKKPPAGKSGGTGKTGSGSTAKTGSGSSGTGTGKKANNSRKVLTDIAVRLSGQLAKFVREASPDAVFEPSFGYERQLEAALNLDCAFDEERFTKELHRLCGLWLMDLSHDSVKSLSAADLTTAIEKVLVSQAGDLLDAGW